MLAILLFFVLFFVFIFIWLTYRLRRDIEAEKYRTGRLKPLPITNEPTPWGVKVFYWGAGLFYATVLASHLAGYP